VHRELKEEINIKTVQPPKFIGFINDDSTEVGRVHLGIVYEFILDNEKIGKKYKQGHEDVGYESVSNLIEKHDEYEEWSKIIIEKYLSTKSGVVQGNHK
jgi:predicted NUDIX family phosphoesterase